MMVSSSIHDDVRAKLIRGGVRRAADLAGLTADQISSRFGLPLAQAQQLPTALAVRPLQFASTWSALRSQRAKIITFSSALDKTLDGGLLPGEVVEICGEPGTGKTQLSMQLAVDAQIPASYGGVEGRALYIGARARLSQCVRRATFSCLSANYTDCEGSFSAARALEMATGLSEHLAWMTRRDSERGSSVRTGRSPEAILAGIVVHRVHDRAAQSAVIEKLPEFLTAHPEVGSRSVRAECKTSAPHDRVRLTRP